MQNWFMDVFQKIKRPLNDGAFYLFWTTSFFEVSLTIFNLAWMISPNVLNEYGTLGIYTSLAFFLSVEFFYERFNSNYEQHATVELGPTSSFARHSRVGEVVGTLFIVINALILPVIAAILSFMSDPSGVAMQIHAVHPAVIGATALAAAMIARTSYVKMNASNVNTDKRKRYNSIIYRLTNATQITIALLILLRTFMGTPVPVELFFLLAILLISYVLHNQKLKECCPEIRQERHGHLVATAVSFITALSVTLFAFDIVPGVRVFPAGEAAGLFFITLLVFYFSTEHKRDRIEKNNA